MRKPKLFYLLKESYGDDVKYSKRDPEPISCCNKTGREFIDLNYWTKKDKVSFRFVRRGFKGKWKVVKYEYLYFKCSGNYVKGQSDIDNLMSLALNIMI